MSKTIALVQARMGSQRFPGKSLTPIWNNVSIIELVLRRLMRSTLVDEVVLTTSDRDIDDPLSELGNEIGVSVYRGDESDVLTRFYDAAQVFSTEAIVRVCGDNPLIDPIEIDRLVEFFWTNQPCDYACNDRLDCGLPDGTGAEIFSYDTLSQLNSVVDGEMREHVSLYAALHQNEFSVKRLAAKGALNRPEIRLDVDYPEDAEFIRQLTTYLNTSSAPYWTTPQIIETLDKNPGLFGLRKDRNELASITSE